MYSIWPAELLSVTQTPAHSHAHPSPHFMLILLANMSRPPSPWGSAGSDPLLHPPPAPPSSPSPHLFSSHWPLLTYFPSAHTVHMHTNTHAHTFLVPRPLYFSSSLPPTPPGCQRLAEAVAMETGPICTLSPWHPPLQERTERRESSRTENIWKRQVNGHLCASSRRECIETVDLSLVQHGFHKYRYKNNSFFFTFRYSPVFCQNGSVRYSHNLFITINNC